MDVQPEIAFRNVKATDELKSRILNHIEKLEKVYDRIVTCRVMVEETNPRTTGKLYHVRVEVSVPNGQVIVNREPPVDPMNRDLGQAVTEAFDRARRQLKEFKERIRENKGATRDLPPHGPVIRLLTDDGGVRYGFIQSGDGHQIYFHENALVDLDYDDLEVGTEVRFVESKGDQGPQASTVAPLPESKLGPRQREDIPLKGEGPLQEG